MKRQAHETSSRTGPAHLSILFTFISMLYKSLLLINNNKLHTNNNLTNYATITILAAYSVYQSQVATNHYYSLDLHIISVRNKTTNFVSLLLYILLMCMMSVILLSIHINRDCLISMCLSSNINFFVTNFKTFFVNLLALTTALTTTNALMIGILSTVITSKLISKLQALTASNCTQGSHFTAICSRVTNIYYQIISILTMCLMTCILSSHANLANHTTTTAVWISSTAINLQLVVFTWLIYTIATINNMRSSSAFTAADMKSLFKNTNSTLSQRCSLSLAVTSGPLQQSLTITRLTAITWNALRLFLSSSAIFLHNTIIRIICCYIYTNTSIPNLLSLLVSISIIRSVYSHFLLGIIILPVYSVTTTCLLMSVILTTSAIIHSLYYSTLWLPRLIHYYLFMSTSNSFAPNNLGLSHCPTHHDEREPKDADSPALTAVHGVCSDASPTRKPCLQKKSLGLVLLLGTSAETGATFRLSQEGSLLQWSPLTIFYSIIINIHMTLLTYYERITSLTKATCKRCSLSRHTNHTLLATLYLLAALIRSSYNRIMILTKTSRRRTVSRSPISHTLLTSLNMIAVITLLAIINQPCVMKDLRGPSAIFPSDPLH